MKRLLTILFLLVAVHLQATTVRLTYNGNSSLANAVSCSVYEPLRQVTISAFANVGTVNIQIKRQTTITEVNTSVTLTLDDDEHIVTIPTTQPNRYEITITLSDGSCYSGVFSIGLSSNNSATYTYDNAGNRNQRTTQ
ncbi:MAG: DUF3244 domain-containing protein [Bacteroidales bacterium]|nr:DUF3244 domain-containing protein [Bacteroidales bacterium]